MRRGYGLAQAEMGLRPRTRDYVREGGDVRTTRRPVLTAYHWRPQVRHSYGWTVTPLATWTALLGERVLSQLRQCGDALGSRFIAMKPA